MRRIFACLLCALLLCPRASGAESPNYVALTFDDGPSGRFTRALLEGLEQRQVKATFLLCGYRLKDYPKEAKRILEDGHEIGLHGYSHDPMNKMSRRELERELKDNLALLPSGCKPVFLRPPGGASSKTVQDIARDMGFGILNWSVDPRDWATRDTWAVEREVIRKVKDGDVILLHDMTDSSVDAALNIVDSLQKEGFRFVTVSELARIRETNIVPGRKYTHFPAE